MTTRFSSLTVVLESDLRDDDAAPLIAAISQLRGVLGVTGGEHNLSVLIAEMRVRRALIQQLADVLAPADRGLAKTLF
jgi:hypothetical protein